MLLGALKHFVMVGVLFTLAGGWVLTLFVNALVGFSLAESGLPPGESYAGSLLLTISSLTLIGIATYFGNRMYLRRFGVGSVGPRALLISTIILTCAVLSIFGPQVIRAADTIERNLSYAYNNPAEAVKLLSMPLLRIFVVPACYVLTGRMLLPVPAGSSPSGVVPGPGGA